MRYLIDTDWVVDMLKGRSEAQSFINELYRDGIAISLITYSEIYEGIYYGKDSRAHESVFLSFLRGVIVIPMNKSIMKQFAHLRGQLRAIGKPIGDFDLLIAATAIYYDLTLVTRNTKHFQRVPGVALYGATAN